MKELFYPAGLDIVPDVTGNIDSIRLPYLLPREEREAAKGDMEEACRISSRMCYYMNENTYSRITGKR